MYVRKNTGGAQMKKRRGILFALGIVLTLSVAVPAVAAENVTGTTVTQVLSRMNKSRKHRKKMRQMQLRFHRYRMKKNLQMLLGQKKKLHRHGKNMKQRTAMLGG